eukprot:878552_1
MFVCFPIEIFEKSPRITVPNQIDDSPPIVTSPIIVALGAWKTDCATCGCLPDISGVVVATKRKVLIIKLSKRDRAGRLVTLFTAVNMLQGVRNKLAGFGVISVDERIEENNERQLLDTTCFDLSYHQRIAGFLMSIFAGVAFLGLSFTLMIIPRKFALCYAFANISFCMSTIFLVGPKKQLQQMFSENRFVLSAVYLSSLGLVLFLALSGFSFVLIVPALIIQFVALAFYIISYLPFGFSVVNLCSSRAARYILPF